INGVAGVKRCLPSGRAERVAPAIAGVRDRIPDLEHLILSNEIIQARTGGVGVLPRALAAGYGVSGPVARASGLDLDLRRDEPYLAYDELFAPGGPGRVVTRTEGDSLARLQVMAEQVHVSLDLAAFCLDRLRSLPPGPIN